MICESCKQEEATILLTKIAADEKQALHLCSTCAAQEAQSQHQDTAAADPEAEPVEDSTSAPAEPESEAAPKSPSPNAVVGHLAKSSGSSQTTCPRCGMSYRQFRKQGRFGCGDCYQAFAAELQRLMKRIHGAQGHTGKQPRSPVGAAVPPPPSDDLDRLRSELEEAVESEAYERAAALRDRIAQLEAEATQPGERKREEGA